MGVFRRGLRGLSLGEIAPPKEKIYLKASEIVYCLQPPSQRISPPSPTALYVKFYEKTIMIEYEL